MKPSAIEKSVDQLMTQDSVNSDLVSDDFADMPIIELEKYLAVRQAIASGQQVDQEALEECQKVAQCFHKFGIILIRDPRVDMADNDDYIDLMEDYFA